MRILALALACAANAALFFLMWFSRLPKAEEQPVFAMIWLTERQAPKPLPAPPPDRSEPRVEIAVQVPPPAIIPPEPGPSTAITVPPIDWYAEGARSARRVFPDAVQVKPDRSLDSEPEAMALPDVSREPRKRGDSERYEGGETITWINERCYYRADPLPDISGAPPRLKLPTCKNRGMGERAREKRAAELEKELNPQRAMDEDR